MTKRLLCLFVASGIICLVRANSYLLVKLDSNEREAPSGDGGDSGQDWGRPVIRKRSNHVRLNAEKIPLPGVYFKIKVFELNFNLLRHQIWDFAKKFIYQVHR